MTPSDHHLSATVDNIITEPNNEEKFTLILPSIEEETKDWSLSQLFFLVQAAYSQADPS